MGLVTEVTKRIDIPHEDGEWLEVRRLSWRELETADNAASEASTERIKRMGGDIIKAVMSLRDKEREEQATGYDKLTVLRLGLIGWSYDVKLSPESIDLLDEETAEFAYREILALSNPRTEEASKNA